MNPTHSRGALALAVALCYSAPALAQTPVEVLGPVVVTGARFDSDPSLLPIGATVVTAAEIRRAGASDVNQAIRKIGGVFGRQSLDGSPDFALDLRGFGTNSSQNLVVMLDGVRLSENELSGAILSTIPIDSVERIEITRGGSSVLYGDGATGGVIQIVTKRPGANGARGTHGSVFAEAGQLGLREGRAALNYQADGWAMDLAAGAQNTDNYRDNNGFKSRTLNGGAQWAFPDGRAGVRVSSTRQDSRFAGSLTQAQFDADPRQASTPNDFGSLDSDRFTAFVEAKLAGYDVAAELSHRRKELEAAYFSDFGKFALDYESRQTQFSPRVRKLGQIGGMLNEAVVGVDFIDWSRDQKGDFPTKATQKSKALYLRDEIKSGPARLAVGVRRELFEKDNRDASLSSAVYDVTQGVNAWDIQGSYAVLPQLTVHAKLGQSYRLPNADENAFTPVFNQVLQPQKSHDAELGVAYSDGGVKLAARAFRHELSNEIFYDPTAGAFHFGANVNLDPTKRQGVELDGSARLGADWSLSGHYQHVKASFTEGPNAGRELVLVPKNVLSARLSWTPADGQSADIGAQWVDSQRFGSDFDNSCDARIPSYATLDARYARKFGPWEVALSGLNLTDKNYYSNAFGCRSGIYPSDGRQVKLSARYDF
jgi:iron complex outermembrane receptor protein